MLDDIYDGGVNNTNTGGNSNDNLNQGLDSNTTANRQTFQNSPFISSKDYKKKKEKKRSSFSQLIAASLVGSILGGLIVFLAMQFAAPAVQSEVGGYIDKILGTNLVSLQPNNENKSGTTYKIEIEKTDSPVTWIAKKVSPSIVGIRVTSKVQNFVFGIQESTGEGSGIIVRENGYIVTNYHVIQDAYDRDTYSMRKDASIQVYLPNEVDKPYSATIIGVDVRTDLAVIKIDATGLPAAELGDSDTLEIGELAVAIGNPGGLEYMGSVTVGVISGLNRKVKLENGYELQLIQTDAAINPGNSGGALVNSQGQVIGVNSVKIVSQGYEGIGFAIPINTVREIFENLIEHKYVPGRPYIGIVVDTTFNERAAKYYGVPAGVLVDNVVQFSGAYAAGIQKGDIITKCEGQQVKTLDELNEIKNKYKPGDKITLEIYRYTTKSYMTVEVELTEEKPVNVDNN